MKAIVQHRYGAPRDVLALRDIEQPAPAAGEVLVRVRAASVHPDVWHVVTGVPYVLRLMGAGLRRPKNPVPGTDVAGTVEAVGANVRFKAGDEVFGETIKGIQWVNGGAYAEYVAVPEERLVPKPANVTFEQAAAVPTSGLIALNSLRNEGRVQAEQRVLINGAGGGVGTIAVQFAKAFGAHVTAVDSTAKLDMLRVLGADEVIDYTREDFTQGGERYDLILDVPGNHSLAELRHALTPTGTYVLMGHDDYGRFGHRWLGGLPRVLSLVAISPFVRELPRPNLSMGNKQEGLALLREFMVAGQITPLVDRAFPLAEVPEALSYLASGHNLGKVVITM